MKGTVCSPHLNHDKLLIGNAITNLTIDCREYEVEFPDGSHHVDVTNIFWITCLHILRRIVCNIQCCKAL